MAKYQLRTFGDIVSAILEQQKIQKTDVESVRRIKRNINNAYMNHIVPFKRWKWLLKNTSVSTEPYLSTGTAIVTQNLTTVTLSLNPGKSRKGYWFGVDGGSQRYRIAAHASGSTSIVLETPFTEATNLLANFKIWTDVIPLSGDVKEVVEVTPVGAYQPLEGHGIQEMRRIQAASCMAGGAPKFYYTNDFSEPDPFTSIAGLPAITGVSSEGLVKQINFAASIGNYFTTNDSIQISGASNQAFNGEFTVGAVGDTYIRYTSTVRTDITTVADPFLVVEMGGTRTPEATRSLLIYPSLSNRVYTLGVDYQLNVEALEFDSDEPFMPVEYRAVLFHGGMWQTAERERDSEWAATEYQLMMQLLSRMAGKTEDTPERPTMRPSGLYLRSKRRGSLRPGFALNAGFYGDGAGSFNGPNGSAPTATGTPNTVAVFDENGYLIGSPDIDIQALEFLVGAQGGLTAIVQPNTSQVLNQWSATQFKGLDVFYQINRGGGAFEKGHMMVSTDGSTVYYGTVGTAGPGAGVNLIPSIFAGNIVLSAVVDNVGPQATISYRVILS